MARSETFQMPLIGCPNAACCQNGATRLCLPSLLRREGELWQLHLARKSTTGRRLWDRRSRPLFGQPRRIQVCSCSRFTRLLLVQLIFLVTDRSRNHGHAP